MKDFIKYIAIIFLFIIGAMIILDFTFTIAFQNGIPRNKVQKIIQSENQKFDYAFFGSSRTENHIDCAVVEKITGKSCINLGLAGSSIGDMLLLIKLAREKNIQFDKVYFQIDRGYNRTGNTTFLKSILTPYYNNEPIIQEVFSEDPNSFGLRIPFYRYMVNDKVVGFREVLASLLNRKPYIDMSNGFWPNYGEGLKLSGKFPREISKTNLEIAEIIELINSQNGEIFFFTSPYCKEAEADNYIKALEKKLPNHYNYVSLFDKKPENFYNCGHLNAEGAREFTKIFISKIISGEQLN